MNGLFHSHQRATLSHCILHHFTHRRERTLPKPCHLATDISLNSQTLSELFLRDFLPV